MAAFDHTEPDCWVIVLQAKDLQHVFELASKEQHLATGNMLVALFRHPK